MLLASVGGFGGTLPHLSLDRSFVLEMDYTGIFGFVIMNVATDERPLPAIAPFVIGATIFDGTWTAHWLYWTAPILGAVLGMRLYDALRTAAAPMVPSARTGLEGPV